MVELQESQESFDARITQEVTSLSTKLVTAVAKLLELEEKILQLRRENQALKTNALELESIQTKYVKLVPEHEKLQNDIRTSDTLRKEAETKISELENEVEDLTASLFDEANKMVSDASRETYNFKVKNGKLQEEIQEKNTIIDNLQDQLKDLKQLFFQIEDQQRAASAKGGKPEDVDSSRFFSTSGGGSISKPQLTHQASSSDYQLDSFIFTPNIRSVRFDLVEYHQEFKPFVYAILKPTFTMDLPNLKTLKYFKKIWLEEIENSILVVPTPSTFINRWQKGKNFWNLIAEGKASIVPISGVNETYKLTYTQLSLQLVQDQPPIATKEPCNFCNEHLDDVLEHARLYSLKLMNPDYDPQGTTLNQKEEVLASYPLCNYCLVKLRNICEFFAKIRLIHSNVYKLELEDKSNNNNNNNNNSNSNSNSNSNNNNNSTSTTSLDSGSPSVSSAKRFNRLSGMISESDKNSLAELRSIPKSFNDRKEEAKLMKLYVMLILIRAKIFWSKIGYWDNSVNLIETNLDEIHYDAYLQLLAGAEEVVKEEEISAEEEFEDAVEEGKDEVISKSGHASTKSVGSIGSSAGINIPMNKESKLDFDPVYAPFKKDDDASSIKSSRSVKSTSSSSSVKDRIKRIEEDTIHKSTNPNKSISSIGGDDTEPIIVNSESEDEFAESTEDFDIVTKESNTINRRKSKSKKFKKKINNDLNETLAMLQESLEN